MDQGSYTTECEDHLTTDCTEITDEDVLNARVNQFRRGQYPLQQGKSPYLALSYPCPSVQSVVKNS